MSLNFPGDHVDQQYSRMLHLQLEARMLTGYNSPLFLVPLRTLRTVSLLPPDSRLNP